MIGLAGKVKISAPIEGINGVYVLKVNSVGNKTTETSEAIATQATDRTKTMVQTTYSFFESLKKMADIKDSRSKMY